MYSHEAWRLLSDAFERVLLHPADAEARAAMLLGSHLAGAAIEQSMLGAAHACANPLTAKYGVTHGLALAILLPASCAGMDAIVPRTVTVTLLGSPRRRARDEDGRRSARPPPRGSGERLPGCRCALRDVGVEAEFLPELAAQAAQQWTGTFNPRPFDAGGRAGNLQRGFLSRLACHRS